MPPVRRRFAQLGIVALLAFAPKCLVCGLAYAGLLGLGGAELCGEPSASPHENLAVIAGIAAATAFIVTNRMPSRRSSRAGLSSCGTMQPKAAKMRFAPDGKKQVGPVPILRTAGM